jgi:phosphoenolpyruvate-protein phosphotransferase
MSRSASSTHSRGEIHGRGISPGFFEGRARVVDASTWIAAARAVAPGRPPEGEAERLRAAQARACTQLEQVESQLSHQGRKDDAQIFAAHASMMRDPTLLERLETAIFRDRLSAEAAVAREVTALHAEFEASPVAMVWDKAADVLDVGHRLVRCLDLRVEGADTHGEPTVLVAQTLTPSELVRYAHQGPCAALLEICSPKSHTAILARSLGVPVLAGVTSPFERVPENSLVLLDARSGLALIDPLGDDPAAQRVRRALARERRERPIPRQPVTRDGVAIDLALNISDPDEAHLVTQLGARGVGLFRTEFLYMDRRNWPSEAESFAAYQRVAHAIGDAPLHIRLADFGADKRPEYADFSLGRNPSLGVRGVRLLLQRDDILGPQVRALASLAEERPVALLVPMLDTVDTLRRLRSRLEALCRKHSGILPFQLGAMIEVPAAALSIEEILEEVDLAAIGLNDLTQYLMAADREDEAVQGYHDTLQPAVLRLVRHVVTAGEARERPISVCGELAGAPALTAALLALGMRRFSVSRSDYELVTDLIGRLSISELDLRRENLLCARTGGEIRRILEELPS